jgi:hypothetical protein
MPKLSNLQLELLQLYGNGISEEMLREVKSVLAKYFADRATSEMDQLWDDRSLTHQQMVDWTNEHNRSENRS